MATRILAAAACAWALGCSSIPDSPPRGLGALEVASLSLGSDPVSGSDPSSGLYGRDFFAALHSGAAARGTTLRELVEARAFFGWLEFVETLAIEDADAVPWRGVGGAPGAAVSPPQAPASRPAR